MPTTRLSSKGQVIIPKMIRETRSWEPGQAFDVIETEEGVLLRPHEVFPPTTFDDVGRTLNYNGPPIPVERLGMEAIPYQDPYEEDDDSD